MQAALGLTSMSSSPTFQRKGIVEGFFGPLWSMAHRKRLFEFGAARGMNTYLYAPKDDPYHRKRWRAPYPKDIWRGLVGLIDTARRNRIDFVYGFHPGEGLCFTDEQPVQLLLRKAARFYDAGVRTFAVLFDDIPSRLAHERDRRAYRNSLGRAEGNWMAQLLAAQPSSWSDVEWWICPSYYTPDDLLARVWGAFEPDFLDKLTLELPQEISCMWTGPAVVPEKITWTHMRAMQNRLRRRLILWDNYPVNDLSMADELHVGPLRGRDPRLPQAVYGYLNNPLVQEELSFIPLATCFDYAQDPQRYRPEKSWADAVSERFGADNLIHWRALRFFFESSGAAKKRLHAMRLPAGAKTQLRRALAYIDGSRPQRWTREIDPWRRKLEHWLET